MRPIRTFFLFLIFAIIFFLQNNLYAQQLPSIAWGKCIGGTGADQVQQIINTRDGGFVFVGYTSSDDEDVSGNHNGGNDPLVYDGWVVKLDAYGGIQWQKCLGGTANDYLNSIIETYDGGYVVSGATESHDGDVKGNHGGEDAWVIKLDSLGNLLWQKCLGGNGSESVSIVESRDEGIGLLAVGFTTSIDGDVSGKHAGTGDSAGDVWVVKLSSSGNILWQKCFGGSANDVANSVISTSDQGYAICGSTYSNDGDVTGYHQSIKNSPDAWVIKLSSSGALEWQKCLGGSDADEARSIIQTSDGGYAITGYTASRDGDVRGLHFYDSLHIANAVWVVKLSASGKIEQQKCLGGSNREDSYKLLQNSEGNFIISGFTSSRDGDVSGIHSSTNDDDFWVVKLDASLNIIWQRCLGGSREEWGSTITQSLDGNLVVAGLTESNDGDVVGNHNPTPIYYSDAWIVELDATSGVDSWYSAGQNENTVQVYPNPSEISVKLQMLPSQMITHVELYNIMGMPLSPEYKMENNNVTIDMHSLSAGTCIARVTYFDGNHTGVLTLPLVVQH